MNQGHDPVAKILLDPFRNAASRCGRADRNYDGDFLVNSQPIGIAEHSQIGNGLRSVKAGVDQKTGAYNARACSGEVLDELQSFPRNSSSAVYDDPCCRARGLLAAELGILAPIMSVHMLMDDPYSLLNVTTHVDDGQ